MWSADLFLFLTLCRLCRAEMKIFIIYYLCLADYHSSNLAQSFVFWHKILRLFNFISSYRWESAKVFLSCKILCHWTLLWAVFEEWISAEHIVSSHIISCVKGNVYCYKIYWGEFLLITTFSSCMISYFLFTRVCD